MSDNTNNAANNASENTASEANKPEAETPEISAAEKFAATFDKRNKAVARVNDDQTAFLQFVNDYFGETNPYKDWASDNAPKLGDNVTFAMVQVEETSENRLIALASRETMFGTGGDEVVRETAYRMILNKALAIAGKADTTKDMFATIGGFLKAKFDIEAFKTFARDVVTVLHAKGLKGITVPTLKLSLSNAAYAKANFPMVKDVQWDTIFGIFQKSAEDAGMDTSILTHWKNTRHAMTSTGGGLEDFTLDGFLADMKDEDEGDTAPVAA